MGIGIFWNLGRFVQHSKHIEILGRMIITRSTTQTLNAHFIRDIQQTYITCSNPQGWMREAWEATRQMQAKAPNMVRRRQTGMPTCSRIKPTEFAIFVLATAMALVNVWHLRRVAEASAKPCDICYKPTTSVLITPDNKVGLPSTQTLPHHWLTQGRTISMLVLGT